MDAFIVILWILNTQQHVAPEWSFHAWQNQPVQCRIRLLLCRGFFGSTSLRTAWPWRYTLTSIGSQYRPNAEILCLVHTLVQIAWPWWLINLPVALCSIQAWKRGSVQNYKRVIYWLESRTPDTKASAAWASYYWLFHYRHFLWRFHRPGMPYIWSPALHSHIVAIPSARYDEGGNTS